MAPAEFLRTPLKIGDLSISPPLVLAPMAENTSYPFRMICKRYGAALTVTEMVTTHPFAQLSRQSRKIIERGPGEYPLAVQICGNEPDLMEKCVDNAVLLGYEIIDLNLGCPVRRMVSRDYGGGLGRYPERVEQLLKIMVSRSRVPVTVKIRKGFAATDDTAVELARIAEACGVAMITVHGRTVSQMYSGRADWDVIRRVKEAVKVPVVGNGDVVDGKSAQAMLAQTGCDGIMIGRGAIGRPWVFRDVISWFSGATEPFEPPSDEMIAVVREHFEMLALYAGESKAALLMRKYLCSYSRGMPFSHEFRRRCLNLRSRVEFDMVLAMLPLSKPAYEGREKNVSSSVEG
ncbi:MAG: tRNA dihydrouridine synthase DusB [Candidatus Brocadiia bacterium]